MGWSTHFFFFLFSSASSLAFLDCPQTSNLMVLMEPVAYGRSSLETQRFSARVSPWWQSCDCVCASLWLCMKWHCAWLYGVHRTCAETAAVSCGTSHASTLSTPLWWIFKNMLQQASHSRRITCECSEFGWERRIALYKSSHHPHPSTGKVGLQNMLCGLWAWHGWSTVCDRPRPSKWAQIQQRPVRIWKVPQGFIW